MLFKKERKLKIDLIPSSAWFSNLRKYTSASQWKQIREFVYEKDNNCCHICGAKKGVDCKKLNAHEIWNFDIDNKLQTLKDIVALCDNCHNCIHFAHTKLLSIKYPELLDKTINHYLKVNKCSKKHLLKDIGEADENYIMRSKIDYWALDITYLKELGFKEIYYDMLSNELLRKLVELGECITGK